MFDKKYFEFHIRVSRKNENNKDSNCPISLEEINELSNISKEFSELFKIPVPSSYNNGQDHQRYLNVRFRNIGSNQARKNVDEIVQAIHNSHYFKLDKIIAEYVPYDSYTQLDNGWIDF